MASTTISSREASRMLQRYRSKCEGEVDEITGLNITAMMDMMTILLVFLLKSFAVSAGMLVPSEADLTLPKSVVVSQPGDLLVVTITRDAILVEGDPVVNVSGSQGVSGEKLVSRSLEIKELKTSLDSYGKINEHNAEQEGRSFERRMLLVADKDTPYYLIVSVVFTARQARYLKYQMVVISTKAD